MTLRPCNYDILTSINNLAAVLNRQDKSDQAARMYGHILHHTQDLSRQQVLTIMNDLAIALSEQGKHDQAEGIHRRELEMCMEALRLEHSSTLMSIQNLAETLR